MFKDELGVWYTEDFAMSSDGETYSTGRRLATKEEVQAELKRLDKLEELFKELDELDRIEAEKKEIIGKLTEEEIETLVADIEEPDLFFTLSQPNETINKVLKLANKEEEFKAAMETLKWIESLGEVASTIDIE